MRLLLLPLALVALLGLAPDPVILFLAGDSTMAQKLASRRPGTGWGEALQQYFDIDRVRVVNLARNGRSTRSFVAEGRWGALLDQVSEGDYVMQRRSTALLRDYGVEGSKGLFLHVDSSAKHTNYPRGVRDDTHFSPHGAEMIARGVVRGIREAVPALAEHLDRGVAGP